MAYRTLTASIVLGICLSLIASESYAQCSANSSSGRQRGQLPTTGSQSLLTMPSPNGATMSTASMYASQRLMQINSANLFSVASQLSMQQKQARAAYRERVLPMRLARAQQTRAKRSERIALAKAKRMGETRYASVEQPESKTIRLTLISKQ